MGLFENENKLVQFLTKIYKGEINLIDLPSVVFYHNLDKLLKGLYKGFGDTLVTVGVDQTELLTKLRDSVYIFSGAKTFNYVLSTQNLIIQNGKVATLEEFIIEAKKIDKTYNEIWLETEYNTCIGQGQSARQWDEIVKNKDIFPYIRYQANPSELSDDRCLKKNGLILPIDHDFWKNNSPLTHYNCACELLSERKKGTKEIPEIPINDNGLRTNAGSTGVAFDKSHPYFDIPKKYKKYLKTNFGFDIPKTDLKPNTETETETETIIKEKPKKIQLEGFEGLHTYGTLTGKDLDTQQRIEKAIGIKVPDKLIQGIEIKNIKNIKNAYWLESAKEINLGGYSTLYSKARILSHELGHARHYEKKQVYRIINKGKLDIQFSDDYNKIFDIFKKELKDNYKTGVDQYRYEQSLLTKLFKSTNEVDKSNAGDIFDSIGDATKGKIGGGHTKKYYKDGHGLEFFAHLSENYFTGNELFKNDFPITYKAGIEYMKNLLNDE